MNLDTSFCNGLDLPQCVTCKRWTEHYIAELTAADLKGVVFPIVSPIAVDDYCPFYSPKPKELNNEAT